MLAKTVECNTNVWLYVSVYIFKSYFLDPCNILENTDFLNGIRMSVIFKNYLFYM